VKTWTSSKNRWERRASAVVFVTFGDSLGVVQYDLKDIFEIARRLLKDEDDLVQKGYGWMLKSASGYALKEVFDFVDQNKDEMPRVALRYSIEKFSRDLKNRIMKQ
jgi:3-methyladenine DNA glycosylase AlkD